MERDMRELLDGIAYSGPEDRVMVTGLTNDSRALRPGEAFVAIPGTVVDGHTFVPQAIKKGAAAIVCEQPPAEGSAPVYIVESARRAYSRMAATWYGYPADELTIIGVTGTNGKTTIITLLRNIFIASNIQGGTIGTFGYSIDGDLYPTSLTTPDSKELHRYFHEMIQHGVKIVAMEVSSHALALNRTADIAFSTGIFTNIGRDHLDFHKTRDAYREEKGKLFRSLASSGCAILNRDSPDYSWFAEQTEAPVLSYALESEEADFFYTRYNSDFSGCSGSVSTPDGTLEIKSQLPGRYNMANILAAIAAARHHSIPEKAVREGVAQTEVEGRMEIVPAPYSAPSIFVDYAHTPDALESILKELQWMNRHEIDRKIIVVFGCGGNRDKEKRPEMGSIAERYADEIIITNDNPRDEDPLRIIEEINEGITRADVIIEPDRRKAIFTAVDLADPRDVVLIAGKGHETTQTIQGKQYPFDDKEIAAEIVKEILAQ